MKNITKTASVGDITPTLTSEETIELASAEEAIHRGFKGFYDAGQALQLIRDKRLYRATHKTFDEYCQERWGIARNYANKLINAADVMGNLLENLGTIVPILPSTESQIRPLTQLPPELQLEAWNNALAASNGLPTANHTAIEARKLKPKKAAKQPKNIPETSAEWASELTFSVEVGESADGLLVEVTYTPGPPHQFEFTGPISITGYACEYAFDVKEFRTPQAYALAKAREHWAAHVGTGPGKSPSQCDASAAPESNSATEETTLPEGTLVRNPGGWLGRIAQRRADGRYLVKFENGLTDDYPAHILRIVEMPHTTDCNPNWTPAADSAALDQDETYIPECLADCTSLDEAAAYLELASTQEVWEEFQELLGRINELKGQLELAKLGEQAQRTAAEGYLRMLREREATPLSVVR